MIILCLSAFIPGGQDMGGEETGVNSLLRLQIRLADDDASKSEMDNYRQIRMEGMPEGLYDLIVTENEYSELLSRGYDIEILSTDYLQSLSLLSDLFFTNESAFALIDSLYQLYPDILRIDSIGTTHEARTIWCVKISEYVDIDDPHKPGIFYSGGIHANELAGTNVVLALLDTLVAGYIAGEQQMIDILQNYQIWIVPILNPDGVAYVHDSQDLTWRKNRRDNGNGCYGVDINRNFGYMWGIDDEGSSPDPCSNYSYRGLAPFSEPESQAIRNFFNGPGSEKRNIVTLITYHMKYGSGAFLYPWYFVDDYTEHHPVYRTIGHDFTTITGNIHGNAMDIMGYLANGSLDEWVYTRAGQTSSIMASTVEAGGGGYMPDYPVDLLLSTHIPANLQLIQNTKTIMDDVRILDSSLLLPLPACDWVAGRDDTLFYGADSIMQIALIQDIRCPQYICEMSLNGSPDYVYYHKSILYTVYSTVLKDPDFCKVIDSIGVYDVTDLYNPIYSAVYHLPDRVSDLQFTEDHIVLLDSIGLKIMSETEMYQLEKVGQYDTPEIASVLAVDGHRACIGRDSSGEGIYVVDISDPSKPILSGQPYFLRDSTGVYCDQLYLKDSLLFISTTDEAAHPICVILDISNPDNILYLSWFYPGEFFGGQLSFYEEFAYIASDCGYYLYDINGGSIFYPTDALLELPEEWGASDIYSAPAPVFLNNYGFVTTEDNGIYVFDAADPFNPVWLGRFGETATGFIETEAVKPFTFHLKQNSPNPFNPSTRIQYGLPRPSDVRVSIYDIAGRQIISWSAFHQKAGWHEIVWDGTNSVNRKVSTGIYICRMQADGYIETKKMLFMK